MRAVLTSEQMAAADRHTIDDLGVPSVLLMERAAQGCVDVLTARLHADDRVLVLIGTGNNGGDGLAIARLLMERGFHVCVGLMFDADQLTGDALTNYRRLTPMHPQLKQIQGAADLDAAAYDWIVDAVFGTGLNRPAEGRFAEVIEAVNAASAKTLAVDIPSGLSGSSGAVPGPAIRADVTVTFQALKRAHVVTPALGYCGELVVHDIGIKIPAAPGMHLLEAADFHRPPRDPFSHKGSYGTLCIIGGFAGMEGAGNLCALSALRFGVGKVRILTNGAMGRFNHDSVMVDYLDQYQDNYSALLIGPGLSRNEDTLDQVAELDLAEKRIIWDADGLALLKMKGPIGAEWAMTPHPGEAAELLGTTSKEIQRDRLAALDALAERYPGGWILLKGYRSLIKSPEGVVYVCGAGNPALAVAGSGDVLSGMIGALAASGYDMGEAVRLACLRHGMAADRWTVNKRDYAMTAEDIIADLVY